MAFPANINLPVYSEAGTYVLGSAASKAGYSVSSAGDVNGDGFDDVIIGAPAATTSGGSYAGASYVVFGRVWGLATSDLASLDGSNGFKLSGPKGNVGTSVSSAGDLNGDGFDDLIVGAPRAYVNSIPTGAGYVVFGKASGFTANVDLATLGGSAGFRLASTSFSDRTGWSVASAGDVNRDGIDDLIIGAPTASTDKSGAAYIIYGGRSSYWSDVNLSALNGSNGYKISGVPRPTTPAGRSRRRATSTAMDTMTSSSALRKPTRTGTAPGPAMWCLGMEEGARPTSISPH